jgi:acetyltransferase-like isoleucine patch superfamily enzyme
MRDVPSHCTAAGSPARLIKRGEERLDEDLPRTELSPQSLPLAE